MNMEITLLSAEYVCDSCDFRRKIADPNDLSDEEIALLNRLTDPTETFTEEELVILNGILDNQIECPTHGRQNVWFDIVKKIILSNIRRIVIDID